MNILHNVGPSCFSRFAFRSLIVILLLTAPCVDLDAGTLHFEISPNTIRQGDAFVIRVSGVKHPFVPAATIGKQQIPFGHCGEGCYIGIGAVGLDTKPGACRVKVRVGEVSRSLSLTVRKGVFRKTYLTLPDEKVSLSPADLQVVEEEKQLLQSLFLSVSDRRWEGDFLIPLNNAITTPFGAKRIMNKSWTSIHRGVDIRGKEGEGIHASNNGKVVFVQELFFGGNTVIIDHGQGIFTVYMHLSGMKVTCGDLVSKSEIIGYVGSTGRSTGPHLHFGFKIATISVNPLSVIGLEL